MSSLAKLLSLIHAFGALLLTISMFLGILLGAYSVVLLWKASNNSSAQNPLALLPWTIMASAFFLQISFTVVSVNETIFMADGAYPTTGLPTEWTMHDKFESQSETALGARLITDVFALVGLASLMRGVFLLYRINTGGSYGSSRQGWGEVISFIIAGAFMMQIQKTTALLGDFIPFFMDVAGYLALAA